MKIDNNLQQNGKDRPLGMELTEITPIVLGGDARDVSNKTWLTRQQHIEIVRYWNRFIFDLRANE
jgi:hypothetical protein